MRLHKNLVLRLMPLLMAFAILFAGCESTANESSYTSTSKTESTVSNTADITKDIETGEAEDGESAEQSYDTTGTTTVTLGAIPEYSGNAYVAINDNEPFFSSDEYTTEAFETYSDLDSLGRCGVAYANICVELMPTEDRESISSVYPSGWNNNPYDFVDGGYVYNRCHLIGFQLAGENANELNLITGTRYLNIEGMLPFENMVADYVEETENHVLYRVTPMYDGDNLVASGVLMEGWSVEDDGDGICFCIYAFNVQPGVTIDYATGENWADSTVDSSGETVSETTDTAADSTTENSEETTYVLNTNTMKFHYPDCSSVSQMSDKNKQEYTGAREDLIEQGYSPCGSCNP